MMDPMYMDSMPLHMDHPLHGMGGGIGGVCDPHMNGLSLQEMIDTDIKAEFDDVLLPAEPGFSNMDTLDGLLDADFKLDDVGSHPHHANPNHHNGFNPSSLSYLEDFPNQGNVMVNPNNVMPVTTSVVQQPQPSPVAPSAPNSVNSLSVNTQFNQTHGTNSVLSPAMASPAYQQQHIQQLSPIVPQQPQTYQQQQATAPSVVRPQHQFLVKPTAATITSSNGISKTVKVLPPGSGGSQHSPAMGGQQVVPSGVNIQQAATVIQSSAGTVIASTHPNSAAGRKKQGQPKLAEKENGYPKPGYSYSCLIALALKNSHTGHLSVSEIYKFMCEHFPYFKTAPAGWKNSVRHNLSLNKCFEKIERPSVGGTNQRKGCLWAMNPAKITKMDEEVLKWSRKDPMAIKKGMVHPHTLEKLERGEMIKDYNANTRVGDGGGAESEDEDDPKSPTSISSQSSSQGYDSAGSDFVDIEGFANIPDSSLPELQLQASGNFGASSIFEELADERLQLLDSPVPSHPVQQSNSQPHQATTHAQQVTVSSSGLVTMNGSLAAGNVYTTSSGNGGQQIVRLATTSQQSHQQQQHRQGGFYPTAIHANYAITPAASSNSNGGGQMINKRQQQTLVVTRQDGPQKVFTVGGPITS